MIRITPPGEDDMQIRSLGCRTDLLFPAFDGEMIDRGHYLVIRTPSNPTFRWGNYLLFDRPPRPGDLEEWRRLFGAEIGAPPAVNHQAFGWDGVDGDAGEIRPFLDAGFALNRSAVMVAQRVVRSPRHHPRILVRPLAGDEDWEAALQLQVQCRPPRHAEEAYREFRRHQIARYRAMIEAGLGAWFGAFLEDRLVGDLGIFQDLDIGRFQHVETHPEHRRRGICAELVYRASHYAFEEMEVSLLVMVAEEDSLAARVYGAVGFRRVERQVGVEWWEGAGGQV